MSVPDALHKAPRDGMEDQLTDEKMHELLARATARLKAKEQQPQFREDTYNFPKLQTGLPKENKYDDSKSLVDEKTRKKADEGARLVVPKLSKREARAVRTTASLLIQRFEIAMRKTQSQIHSSRAGRPFWLSLSAK